MIKKTSRNFIPPDPFFPWRNSWLKRGPPQSIPTIRVKEINKLSSAHLIFTPILWHSKYWRKNLLGSERVFDIKHKNREEKLIQIMWVLDHQESHWKSTIFVESACWMSPLYHLIGLRIKSSRIVQLHIKHLETNNFLNGWEFHPFCRINSTFACELLKIWI